VFFVVSAADVYALKPVYKKWMIGAHFIGNVISTIVLSVFFYFVFGIVGIVLRIIRKDLLDQKIDYNRDSYWIEREQKLFNKKSYHNQF